MFRKPKQSAKNKAAMRKRTVRNNDDGDDDNDDDRRNSHEDDGGSGNKRTAKSYRAKSNDSDDESTSSHEWAVGTRYLLEQIRREKMGPSGGGKKRRFTDTSVNNDHDEQESGQKNKQGDVMHKFESSSADHRLSASDMATRAAEYHPTNVTKGSISTSTGREGGPNDTAGIENTEKGEGKKNKIYQGQNRTRNPYHAGPLKAPTFVRTTCRFDYQPDICKDYKDTGFCGFGDTCIYLHDRGDTLTGWQLERQWEEQKKKEREEKEREMDKFIKVVSSSTSATGENAAGGKDLDEDEDGKTMTDDGLPFACYICRNPFIDPVITTCGHYFCEKCIMGRVRGESLSTGSACPICGKDTHGVFNHPTKLLAKKRRLVGSEGTWEEFADAARGKK